MKKAALFAFILCLFTIANAQLQLRPKWEIGKAEQFEFIHSEHELTKDGTHGYDSIHADIQLVCVSEEKESFDFEWVFLTFYQHSTIKDSTKRLAAYMHYMLNRKVHFSYTKSDLEFQFDEYKLFDSITGELVRAKNKLENKTGEYDVNSGSYDFERAVSRNIHMLTATTLEAYFLAYDIDYPKMNERVNLKDSLGEKGALVERFEGYMLLDDATPGQYNYHTERKADIGKIAAQYEEENYSKEERGNEVNGTPSLSVISKMAIDVALDKQKMTLLLYKEMNALDGLQMKKGRNFEVVKTLRKK